MPDDSNNDEVDADVFWSNVDCAMIFRGFLHSGTDANILLGVQTLKLCHTTKYF